jgi:hypothetical protein
VGYRGIRGRWRRPLLSEKSPQVTRGGYTTAERDAWVSDQVADLKFEMDKAEIVRSLGASVRQAYELAGVTS